MRSEVSRVLILWFLWGFLLSTFLFILISSLLLCIGFSQKVCQLASRGFSEIWISTYFQNCQILLSDFFIKFDCENQRCLLLKVVTMCDKVTMIRGVYYERLWQCQGCSDKGRSYLLKQPAGPEAMMRSKRRNMRTGYYHCDKDSFGTWEWREIQGQGSFSSKVIAISLSKLHLDTSTLEWIRSVSFYSWQNCS